MTAEEKKVFNKMRDLLEDVLKSIKPDGGPVNAWLGLVQETVWDADRLVPRKN